MVPAFSSPGGVGSASLRIDLGGNERVNRMAIGGDKKPAVVSWNIPGGSANMAFHANGPVPGELIVDLCGNGGNDIANTIFRLPDRRFLVGGTTDCNGTLDFAIARVTNEGVVDPRFTYTGASGPGVSSLQPGVILVDFGGTTSKVTVGGYTNSTGDYDFAVATYLPT
jgi:hypothetical protein